MAPQNSPQDQPTGAEKADAAARKHKQRDTPEQRQAAHEWLDYAAGEFDLPGSLHRAVAKDLLDLTRRIAYERSRPAAPLTLFLLGVAAGRAVEDEDANPAAYEAAVQENLAKLVAELDNNPQ